MRSKPRHVIRRRSARPAAPVAVSFAPLASLLADTRTPLLPPSRDGKDPYLWLAGFAFALLALAGLSLCFVSTRHFQVRAQ